MVPNLLKRIATETFVGRLAYKAYIVTQHYPQPALRRPMAALKFILTDREIANFTYEIGNYDELHRFIARNLGCPEETVRRYSLELREDADLTRRLGERLAPRKDRKAVPLYGRRVGWYCAVRVKKPSLVVETGVSDGLGSAVLLRALERNRAEGQAGRLIGIDIDPTAGWLLDNALTQHYQLVIEDSQRALPRVLAGQRLELFIHDSNHHYAHERAEYALIKPFLTPDAVILSDNAHAVPALEDFSKEEGRPYDFFHEEPVGHFYPGAGIGLSRPSGQR
jgi:hypothetical protein